MNVIPVPGTPEHDTFMRRARDPNSVEAHVIRSMVSDQVQETQVRAKEMLHQMIDLVPGQLFRDIGRFHAKFGLEPTNDPNHRIPPDLLEFRIKFMLEELIEYAQACGVQLEVWNHYGDMGYSVHASGKDGAAEVAINSEKAFDGLIDLIYVALGTAFLHRFPFNDGWDRVQEKNMAKVRATGADDERSARKHSADIVKPEGWTPPVLNDLLGPYAQVHSFIRNHDLLRVLLIVTTKGQADALQGDFPSDRCSVTWLLSETPIVGAGKAWDAIFVEHGAHTASKEKRDSLVGVLKTYLNPGGVIVGLGGTEGVTNS